MKSNDYELLQENTARHNKLFPYYNALTGEGSKEKRFAFVLNDNYTIYLPEILLSFPLIKDIVSFGGLHKYQPTLQPHQTSDTWKIQFLNNLDYLRIKHDFEYFCFTRIKIEDKETGVLIPFKLRAGQRKLLHHLESLRLSGKPIRIILDKARQWGGSTMTQIYMLWIQLMWRGNWNSVIGTDVFLQAETIRHMYEIAIEEYPDKQFTFKNAKGIKNVKVVEESNCQIRLSSMQRPKSLRSGSYKMAHFSETALWTTTEYTKPEDLISSIVSAIPFIPYTIIVNESTAKGEGNYFHRQWLRAIREESGFCPVFVAWWEIEIYSLPFASDEEKITFYNNLDDYGKFLWSLGATLESIHWYKNFQKGQGFEDWQMHEEYPSTWQESFIASGERVIPLKYMSVLQKYLRTPKFVGDIHADGKKNAEALQNIHLVPNTQSGCLQIWEYPDKNNRFSNRYVVSMDIGGRSSKADYTVIRVLDRYWRTEGGVDEFVATWRGHGDVDLLVWKAVQLAKLYDNALLVVESNTIDSKYKHTEGEHSYTVFDEIVPYYNNLYVRNEADSIKNNIASKYGFFTSQTTKTTIIDNLIGCLRDEQFIEHDAMMEQECNEYEYKDNRPMGAKEGCHDDVLMTSAIALFVSKNLPTPKDKTTSNQIIDVSSIV